MFNVHDHFIIFFSHKGDIFLTMLLFFFSVLNRVLEPTVLMEMTLSDGNIHTFEVRDLPLLCLRYDHPNGL